MISISVIIPIYNVEQYVQRCLASVMAQDCIDASIECIIIDDCSPDKSMDIVREMVADYHGSIRFRLLKHDRNRGLSAVRNTGLQNAVGDYVFFIDSDDYLKPDSFHYFCDNLEKYPDIDMVVGNVEKCEEGDTLIRDIQEPYLIDDCNVFFSRMLHHQIYLYAWNKMIRRDLLMEHRILFEQGILYEDQSWSYLLFSHLSSVLLLPEVTYVYENNPSSIINTTFTEGNAYKVIRSYTKSTLILLDNPPNPDRYSRNMVVDYLLFMDNYLMNGVDVLSRFPMTTVTGRAFYAVRLKLLFRSLRYGRLLLSCFFLVLFSPLCYLQKLRFFRRHYYNIESVVNIFAHLTDFLHRKEAI